MYLHVNAIKVQANLSKLNYNTIKCTMANKKYAFFLDNTPQNKVKFKYNKKCRYID